MSNFGTPDRDQLAGLLLELASQLHLERARRIALETALIERGVLGAEAIDGAAGAARAKTLAALDTAMAGLMRVMAAPADRPAGAKGESV
jgi:hypothetical protein